MFFSEGKAQKWKHKEDSLLSLLDRTDSIHLKIALYTQLHNKTFTRNHERAFHYAQKRVALVDEYGDPKLLVSAYNAMGWFLTNTIEKPDEAKPYLEKALKTALEINDSSQIATSLTYNGFMYQMKSYYKTAMDYYLQSIAYKEKLPNKRGLAFSYNLVGKVYEFQGNYKKSLEYHQIALELRKKYTDSLQVAHSLKNMGWSYLKDQQHEKSIAAFERSIELSKRYHHRRRISFGYNGLGSNYLALQQADTALAYFKKALVLSQQINIDFNVSQALVGCSNAYFEKGDYKNAQQTAEQAVKVIGTHRYFDQLKDAYRILYKVSEKQKRPQPALDYFKKFQSISDSISNKETQTQIAEMELRFNAEKKERELAQLQGEMVENKRLLEGEKNNRKLLYTALLGIGSILLIGSFFYRKNLRQKKRLKTMVSEKNTLLKETNHRVKNSFQVVSGLLYLQSSTIKNEEASQAFNQAQNRINAMALLHQRLYKKDHLDGVNAKEYLENLVLDIIQTQSTPTQQLQKKIEVTSFILDIETISYIGLIVNELVTNSLKHAFVSTSVTPLIEVSLQKKNETLQLQVTDNGSGIKDGPTENTMGLSLIEDLAKKLNASIDIQNVNETAPFGTRALLSIKKYNLLGYE